MMKTIPVFLLAMFSSMLIAQEENPETVIKRMSWAADYKIELTLKNDSVYIYDIKNLHHSDARQNTQFSDFTYYPVSLSEDFIAKLKKRGVDLGIDTTMTDSVQEIKEIPEDKTLWSALHSYIGGGWVHFVNTMLYTIEGGYLDIRSPLMKRPDSKWKPKPPTESYLRTKNWDYYVPVTQSDAIKEYKIRQEKNELGNLALVPQKFIELFLNTSDKDYKDMVKRRDFASIARLDMIKLLLGANYLGKPQIKYIKHMVLKAVMQYSQNRLPSVIMFDNFNAAVALTLNEKGYMIEKIIFSDEKDIPQDQIELREKTIRGIIDNINEVNKEIFREKLKNYYN